MPVSAATLSKLIAAGLSGDDLIAVVASIDADMEATRRPYDEQAERRRAADRERMRVRRQSADMSADTVSPKKEIPPTPPKEKTPLPPSIDQTGARAGEETPVSKPKPASRKTRLPADWQPSEKNRADAHGLGLTDVDIEREARKFRDRQLAHGGAYIDWNAAWRNWCSNSLEFARGKSPPSQAPPGEVMRFKTVDEIIAERQQANGKG